MTEAVQSPLLPDITTAPVYVENCDANDADNNEETDQKGIITRSGSVNGKKKLKVKQVSPCNAECLDITDKKSVDRRSTRSKSRSRMFEDFTATDNEGLDITETRSVGRRSTRSKLRPRMFDDFADYDNEAKVSAKPRTVNKNFESLKKAATADCHVQVKNKRIVRKSFYPCIICNHPCKTVKELTDHCDKLHKGALFKCPVCSLEYLTFKKLRNHQYYQKHFPLNVTNEGDSPMTNRAENIPFSHNQLKTPVEDPVVSSASVNNNVLPAKRKLTFDDSIVGTAEDDVEEGEGVPEVPETGVTISIPGPPGPELSPCDTNDKPLMILICPIVSCTTKVPIYDITTNESLQAQEYIHNHQKIAHNFTEKQFCSQVVFDHDQEDDKKGITTPDKRPGDNLSLVLSSDSEESDAVEVPENLAQSQQSGGYEEMETSQIWNQKLMKTWKQLRRRYFDILGEIFIIVTSTATSSENGKEHYDYSFKIGNLSASGSGDSRMLAKEDAAYNMYVKLVNQVDHNDAESVRSVICG